MKYMLWKLCCNNVSKVNHVYAMYVFFYVIEIKFKKQVNLDSFYYKFSHLPE